MTGLIILLILAGIAFGAWAAYFGFKSSDVPAIQVVNVLSSTGSVVSFFGLIIAFVQIWSVRRIAEAGRRAAEQTRDRLTFKLTVYDISRAITMVDEIQAYISREGLESALLRLGDLHQLLLEFGQHKYIQCQTDQRSYSLLCKHLGTELHSLRNAIRTKPATPDLSDLSRYLVTAKTQLSQIGGAIKYTETTYEN
jgi:hypothetical protein